MEQQKTIRGKERPLDEPTESGKYQETDEKRLARILTTIESWSEQQKKPLDSGGNLPVAFYKKKKKKNRGRVLRALCDVERVGVLVAVQVRPWREPDAD